MGPLFYFTVILAALRCDENEETAMTPKASVLQKTTCFHKIHSMSSQVESSFL